MFCALALTALLGASDVHFSLEGLTNAPVDAGGRLGIELPFGFELSTEVGVMPSFYADAVNELLLAAHVYSPQVGVLVRTALQSSFVWRSHLGFRPFPGRGFYIAAGYGLLTFGGGATAGEALAGPATGKTAWHFLHFTFLPASSAGTRRTVEQFGQAVSIGFAMRNSGKPSRG